MRKPIHKMNFSLAHVQRFPTKNAYKEYASLQFPEPTISRIRLRSRASPANFFKKNHKEKYIQAFSPDCLLVVHEGLVQLALLLQDGGEVRVGGGELGEDLQGLEVEPRRLLDVALLALDVRKVVQGVRVGGGKSGRE